VEIGLIEQPEYKRRWSADDLDERVKGQLRERLLDRIETALSSAREPQSVRAIAHGLEREPEVRALGEVLTGRADFDLERLAGELLAEESGPAFAACRYTATGLEKRAAWERVWELQRREDRGEKVGEIEPPQKYTSADFQGDAWTHRGKLDVPKERFISYPGCEGGGDSTPLYGWAGCDHLQRARALAQLFERCRREDRWEGDRLVSDARQAADARAGSWVFQHVMATPNGKSLPGISTLAKERAKAIAWSQFEADRDSTIDSIVRSLDMASTIRTS